MQVAQIKQINEHDIMTYLLLEILMAPLWK